MVKGRGPLRSAPKGGATGPSRKPGQPRGGGDVILRLGDDPGVRRFMADLAVSLKAFW
jgi:hypothetical protein